MLTLVLAHGLQADAKQVLIDLERVYEAKSSFSMRVVHHDSSGLYPGDYEQKLAWRKGGRFELKVSKPASGKVERKAPNYYCDGKWVVSLFPDGRTMSDEVQPRPNTSPGWEVTGGFILSWLEHSPMSTFLTKPPQGITINYTVGSTKEWQGEKVVELIAATSIADSQRNVSFFVSTDHKRLVGFAWGRDGSKGWAHYSDQREPSKLPATLGDPPKS